MRFLYWYQQAHNETRARVPVPTLASAPTLLFISLQMWQLIHMQKVLTAAEMREVDRLTTEKYGIPPLLLMENAAQAAARVICEKFGGSVKDRSVLVLCGKGNNGGDGAALARILWQLGADVEVCLFGLVEDTKNEAKVNFEILQKIAQAEDFELDQSDLAFEEIAGLEEWLEYDSVNFTCDDPDIIVDALFGTGLERPLDGVFEQVAAYISAFAGEGGGHETLVVALDVPSGLNSDLCVPPGSHAAADMTVTFTSPKLANVMPPAERSNGRLYVASIGSPCELVNSTVSQTFVSQADDVAEWLSRTDFESGSYKNKRGHVLIVAGSRDYSGAAVLAGNAAIHSGVGLATIMTPRSCQPVVASRVDPEVMVRGGSETDSGAFAAEAIADIAEFAGNIDLIAVGPGLSSSDESTKRFVRRLVEERTTPIIIDADALNCLAPWNIHGSLELPLILTPHDGEFARLTGTQEKLSYDDRIETARQFAIEHDLILLLKGERSIVAEPSGRVVINPTGGPGTGKAGNGDTLTGIMAGFAAQAVKMGVGLFETTAAALYLAGLAGEIASERLGDRIMSASDVRHCSTLR